MIEAGARQAFAALVLASLPSMLSAQQGPAAVTPPAATPLVFDNVTVIDVQAGKAVPDQRVVIAGNRIQAAGPTTSTEAPQGARVVNARGKFLIPGLWDMHLHVETDSADNAVFRQPLLKATYLLNIGYGITGVREMAQRAPHGADSFRVWQRAVREGKLIGPRAIGPSADLSWYAQHGGALATPDDVRRVIDSLKAADDAFAKFHGEPNDTTLYYAILREARRVKLPIDGHVPMVVQHGDAADSGQRSLEHLFPMSCFDDGTRYYSINPEDSGPQRYNPERCATFASKLVRNGTWITPTLVSLYYLMYLGLPELGGVQPLDVARARWPATPSADLKVPLIRALDTLKKAGVRMLAGSDASSNMFPMPGFALQQELGFLVESAGLTPLEALQTATLNPAQFLEATDSLGTVAAGKLADMVLLDGNPLTNIHNTEKISAVVADGRYFDRPTLDAILLEGKQTWPQ